MNKTKCYTFYSYKGGSGRSTTAINTVKHLVSGMGATPKKPILIVDADLESAGLTYFFGLNEKIYGEISETLHAMKIFSRPQSFLNARETWGKSTATPEPLTRYETCISAMKKIFSEKDMTYFEPLELTESESALLEKMFIKVAEKRKTITEDNYTKKLLKYFNPLTKLLPKFKAIYEDSSMTEGEKREARRRAIHDFMPPTSFVDISEHFGAEAGTVRFLGADVLCNKEQILRNGADSLIDKFIYACDENDYSAVIFDCGAGTQSSANALHKVSDVIVYCMRPTMQFAIGTNTNLSNYKEDIIDSMDHNEKKDGKKAVIILPTAVPMAAEGTGALCLESFARIKNRIAAEFSYIVDDTFCTPETALCEVELFKWREQILGAKDPCEVPDDVRGIISKYERYETMPGDAKRAYDTYRRLAERLIYNSTED